MCFWFAFEGFQMKYEQVCVFSTIKSMNGTYRSSLKGSVIVCLICIYNFLVEKEILFHHLSVSILERRHHKHIRNLLSLIGHSCSWLAANKKRSSWLAVWFALSFYGNLVPLSWEKFYVWIFSQLSLQPDFSVLCFLKFTSLTKIVSPCQHTVR